MKVHRLQHVVSAVNLGQAACVLMSPPLLLLPLPLMHVDPV